MCEFMNLKCEAWLMATHWSEFYRLCIGCWKGIYQNDSVGEESRKDHFEPYRCDKCISKKLAQDKLLADDYEGFISVNNVCLSSVVIPSSNTESSSTDYEDI